MYLSEEYKQYIADIDDRLNEALLNNTLYDFVIIECFGIENLLPEDILRYKQEIIQEANNSQDDKGEKLVASALNLTKNTVSNYLKDTRNSSKLFAALRNKLDEVEDKQYRARSEERGFLAMLIYTIKSAMKWMISKFQDLKDYVVDTVKDRPEGYSSARRNYKYLSKKGSNFFFSGDNVFKEPRSESKRELIFDTLII